MGREKQELTRRSFLAGTGVVAAGAAAAGLAGCSSNNAPPAADSGAAAGGAGEIAWTYEADLIVVGTGPAGTCAAAAAAEAGISVIAIDANDKFGGKGILAGGNIGIGGGNRLQEEAGWHETADIIFEDRVIPNLRTDKTMIVNTIDGREHEMGMWRKISGCEDGIGVSRAFADASLDTWNWLDGMGVQWLHVLESRMSQVYRGSRYFSEVAPALVDRDNGKPGDMQAGGAGFMWPLYDTCIDNGVEFKLNCKMTKIIRADGDRAGRVLGIEADDNGTPVTFKANKAVFIGTGSWNGSKSIKQLFNPWLVHYPHISGEPYVFNDGSGIEIAIDAGASLSSDRGSDWHGWHRHAGTLWHDMAPPYGLTGTGDNEPLPGECIFVNAEGERFMDETIGEDGPPWIGGMKPFFFGQICATQTIDQDGPIVWIILDEASRVRQELDLTPGTVVEESMYSTGSTIEELANGAGLPAAAVAAAVTRWNEIVDLGVDEDFGKPDIEAKIETPPFHAIKWGIMKHNTIGGITINGKAQVLDWKYEPIPGLYAAGEVAGAMDTIGLARPIVFGRIAGMTIAAEE